MAQRAIEALSGLPLYVSLTNGFMTRTGQVRFELVGRDGDEDEDGDDGDEGEDGDEGDEGQGSSTDKKDDDDTETEADRLRKRMKAADKNNSALQRRIKELEDKDKDEKTRAEERATELESENTSLKETLSSLRLENAFLVSNDQTWDDPEYALDYAQRRGYLEDVVDDDGSVDKDALKKALKRLATDKPRFLAAASTDSDDGEQQQPPATDQGVGGKRKKDKDAVKVDPNRFPSVFR